MGFVEDYRFLDCDARCVFFDRLGGVSPPPFDSLNVSLTVGDKKDNVDKNLSIIKRQINADFIGTVDQIHSNKIVEFDGIKHKADGIYTFQKGVFLGIKFADCVPIAFCDKKTKLIGVVHAGWRGTYLCIAKKMTDIFLSKGSNLKNIIISIGPHICEKCYEIKEDVASKFNQSFINHKNGKLYLDLGKTNMAQLISKGIPKKNINDLSICTFEDKRFFSYRRDKICGRNIGGIIKF